jgi:response regulator RpfG family c-di-GMP phosphodiesterase
MGWAKHTMGPSPRKTSRREFDLVLSDIVMPGIDGFTLLKQFLSLARHAPVILMSGNAGIDQNMAILRGLLTSLPNPFFSYTYYKRFNTCSRIHLRLRSSLFGFRMGRVMRIRTQTSADNTSRSFD